MNKVFNTIGFTQILEGLSEYANTDGAKERIKELKPYLSEFELRKQLKDTSQGRGLIEKAGNPPIPIMEGLEEMIDRAVKGDMLTAEEIEEVGSFLAAVDRLYSYLESGKQHQISLAWYSENLHRDGELREEIERTIRGGRVDDYASKNLKNARKNLQILEEKIRLKAEHALRVNKSYLADSFVVERNGRICIPIKAHYKNKVEGAQIDSSSTNATIFIEPKTVAKLRDEIDYARIVEEEEERIILYSLADKIAESEVWIKENIRVVTSLDFVFAKGKMSIDMEATEPEINAERIIVLRKAKHPLLEKQSCIPLDFSIGEGVRGVVITGPNTGGKTVAIKTVALLSAMACAGLHVPAEFARISMNNQILCDIGDGQNIKDNLSTFSAHMKSVIEIMERVDHESLVILDELGSGTDPAEGMGIAIAILESLRKSRANFLVTTHYPEVKEYADRYEEIQNARMAFDRESLKPLYKLEIGKAGESCALYIAKRLGVPHSLLRHAAIEAYGEKAEELVEELQLSDEKNIKKRETAKIQKLNVVKKEAEHGMAFTRGDSVTVMPEGKIGIVVNPADKHGEVLVQVQKEKIMVNHKRLKLKVAASSLYPEDYDFTIIFDTVENRKARHKMTKGHQEGIEIKD